ncbi:MAG: 3-isopropylmalate dehydratase small subunit [Candidatus Omnitrophica bacterium]|nr:3-isopropylmalate dehydratase small subunit [Candidatus Omnitrophota bacterium]
MIKGRVWKFGDDINTDLIIPARYLNMHTPEELAQHCMEDADPGFAKNVRPGDIIVAGKNFGCGSSREHAPISIKGAGVALVIAASFARIFFRNSLNMGLPLLECDKAVEDLRTGDEIEADLERGSIIDKKTGKVYHTQPYPDFMKELIGAGGLMNWIKVRREHKR